MIALTDDSLQRSAVRKVCLRLVPFVGLMFFINFLDRTAISFAGPNGLTADLGMTAAQFGFASGVFFLGYIFLEIPSNLALNKFGARLWLSRIMITWGIVAALFAWVSTVNGLYWLRFFLGVAEAGFFPGAILFLSQWVPARHRSTILALFYVFQPLTTVIGAPVASLLLMAHGAFGIEGWRIMFLGVSIPAILVGVVALFYLDDGPMKAKWLSDAEKKWLCNELSREVRPAAEGHHVHAGAALLSGRVWLLCLIYFGFIYGLYALAFFLPTIISGFEAQFGTKFGLLEKGLITAIPYLPAAIALYLWSRDATRRGVRAWHVGIPAIVGGLSVPAALYMNSPAMVVVLITLTACSIFAALPNFWSIPSRFLSGAAAAAGIALINTVGNIAGFSAPYITGIVKDWSGSYQAPMFIVGALMLMSGLVMFAISGLIRSKDEDPIVLKAVEAFE
ncbi:MAG: MFS transporter [Ancalomicrobiaceae bacterium]|nr:MFS transporter [Ancalomicrobiaceae bacterium]